MSNTLTRSSAATEALTASYWIRIGRLLFEKCELQEAKQSYLRAYEIARSEKNPEDTLEALLELLRYSAEACDTGAVTAYEKEILTICDSLETGAVPPKVWYCRSVVHDLHGEPLEARKMALKYLQALKLKRRKLDALHAPISQWDKDDLQSMAEGFLMLSKSLTALGHTRRAERVCRTIIERFEHLKLKGINGSIALQLATIHASRKDLRSAIAYIHKAHASYLEEHDWYSHLYVLLWYSRVARLQQNLSQAAWYLDLLEKAAPTAEFGILREQIRKEKNVLDDDVADLVIDSRKGSLKLREGQEVSLGKQYVLLDILKALSEAYNSGASSQSASEKGLTKAEIIQKVWREKYRPEAHDNKLYYNINRLRKLIEPDLKRPKYLLNWKEGYRFAPGLKVQLVSESAQKSNALPKERRLDA